MQDLFNFGIACNILIFTKHTQPMKRKLFKSAAVITAISLITLNLNAQEKIEWLDDFTSDILSGSNTYSYDFYTLDDECKIKIEEKKTNKKGVETLNSNVFYLSDISPSSLNFKSSGKVLIVNMETKQSQKFISHYEGDEFQGYTNEISMYTSEVDKARSLIDAFLSHIETCKDNEKTWTSREEAIEWLKQNIGESELSGTSYEQSFGIAEKPHLAVLEAKSTSSKGEQKLEVSKFDLSDIDSDKIELVVSGKSLKINLPVKEKLNFVKVITNESNTAFTKALNVFVDDVEVAREQITALRYLIDATEVERTEYTDYNQAMSFAKDNLGEIKVGSNTFSQSLSYENSPSGQVNYSSVKTDSKGVSKEQNLIFYLSDINPEAKLNVSTSSVEIELTSISKVKYIKQMIDKSQAPYISVVTIYADDIDAARDLITALNYSLKSSDSGIEKFEQLNEVKEWLTTNLEDVNVDSKNYKQTAVVALNEENKIDLSLITSSDGENSVNETFEIYPEDLAMEEIVIKISGKKLSIPLSTGKIKYIKSYEEGIIQNYTTKVEVLFNDVKTAKSFISAVDFLHGNSVVDGRSFNDETSAFTYLTSNLGVVESGGNTLDQKIEKVDENSCKLKYTLKETSSKGSVEHVYEFMASDIDPENSEISIFGKELKINLVTKGKEKLIKPYKDGEAGNFTYNIDLYTDDVLTAKEILAAFQTMSRKCE